MNTTENTRSVPLGISAYVVAREFEAEQLTPGKGRRVYLNTLAVYAVYTYLRWLQIDVDLSLGESWNLRARGLFDVADLVITNVGKLECRPVLPGETKIYIPPEVAQNRIGYVAVEIDETEGEALLLGFTSTIELDESEEIQLDYFQPIDTLLDAIPENIEENPEDL